MNRKEEFDAMKKEYQHIIAPKNEKKRIEEAIMQAKIDKKRKQRKKYIRSAGIAAVAMLALVILPNTNAQIAHAMENLPVVGGLFKVITIREYSYEDTYHRAEAQIPQIQKDKENTEANTVIETTNQSVDAYIDTLLADFEASMEEEEYHALDISYEVVTDTKDWFTLRINATDTQASGYQTQKFYHIDKTTGKTVNLQDLFESQDYIANISTEIIRQMTEQMEREEAVYFLDDDDGTVEPFTKIKENQNFYFNEEGNMVIVFDEYEVGPGYIGCPEFVMPTEIFCGP